MGGVHDLLVGHGGLEGCMAFRCNEHGLLLEVCTVYWHFAWSVVGAHGIESYVATGMMCGLHFKASLLL